MRSFVATASAPIFCSLPSLRRNTIIISRLSSISSEHSPPPPQQQQQRSNYAGIQLEETVDKGLLKARLDAWIASRMQRVSRARIQSSIRSGLVSVNGRIVDKVSHVVKGGDIVSCTVSELQPLRAEAEDLPLDIIYEDNHVIVVNKPPHMVVHPAPGNARGTLVNAILHHCKLSTFTCLTNHIKDDNASLSEESEEELPGYSSDEEIGVFNVDRFSLKEGLVRPGIVHRLDKGTSGLLVVAKDEHSHAQLAEQFKLHAIKRVYTSLTIGVPNPNSARIEVPISRDLNNRVRMVASPGSSNRHARYAASIK